MASAARIATPLAANVLFYSTPDATVRVEVRYEDETFWLPQKGMATLFGADVRTISEHLGNIFASGELSPESTLRNFRMVQTEGARQVTRDRAFYNLDAIIAVGYRVNSREATQFRIWATQTLRAFIIKGFVLDGERLKQGQQFGQDYFEDLLERIREIRASERRFYQKVTDLYALSADYDATAPETKTFFATVQNKLHWAITGQTAAERIHAKADAHAPHMGLTTWKHAPHGKVLKSDVGVAKNYLDAQELKALEGLLSGYLELAENRAQRQILTRMTDWGRLLNSFLELAEYPVLQDAGKIRHAQALLKAEQQYAEFRVRQDQDFESDFDREVARLTRQGKGKRERGSS